MAWLGKAVVVFVRDGEKVLAKRGVCLSEGPVLFDLRGDGGVIGIPIHTIVRVEEQGRNSGQGFQEVR